MGSELPHTFRRAAVVAGAVCLITAGLGGVSALQAAASSATVIQASSSAYADSAMPGVSHVDPAGGIPVGAHTFRHGPAHVTKAYFTFDLSRLAGTDLQSAVVRVLEPAVGDCSATTAPQAWLTDTDTSPTWVHQPVERAQLGPVNQVGCPSSNLAWDGTKVLSTALAAGRSTATLTLRLPSDEQSDPAHGITVGSDALLLVRVNRAPLAPTGLRVQKTACSDQPVLVGKLLPSVGMVLSATVTDPDGDGSNAEFDWWPVNDPDQRHVANGPFLSSEQVAQTTLVPSQLSDATTYAWQVRATDGTGTGPFSPVCEFTTEFTTPPETPIVTSTDYPPSESGPGNGGSGEPGAISFSGSGDLDITEFAYGLGSPDTFVTADHPGGTATIQITPSDIGPDSFTVWTVDRAGDLGASVTYQFWVANNEPLVSCTPASAFVGTPRQCTFTPRSTDVAGFQYQLADGPVADVQANPDGTTVVTVTPIDSTTGPFLHVRARLANGNLTAETVDTVQTNFAAPTVGQNPVEGIAGTPVAYTVHASLPNSVSFTYTLNGGIPVTVPVASNGTATVTLTSDSSFAELDVFSTTSDGVNSGTQKDFPFLDSDEPVVTSTDYPEDSTGGGVGVPDTFTFTSPVPDVVSYTYTFDGDEETVPAGPDGAAQVVLTPTDTSAQELLVSSALPDGATSDVKFYSFLVNESPTAGAGSARMAR
jgi:hypothetical protein